MKWINTYERCKKDMNMIKKFSSNKNYEKIYERVFGDGTYINSEEYKKAPKNVQQSILAIRQGSFGAGTQTNDLIKAFDLLNSKRDFEILDDFLQKYPKHAGYEDGYSSIEKLLNGELEGDNYWTCYKIANKLASIGVRMTYRENFSNSPKGDSLVLDSIKVPSTEQSKGKNDNLRVGRLPSKTTPATPETPKPNDNEYWQKQAQEQSNKNKGPKPLPDNEGPIEKEFEYQFPNEKNYSYAFKDDKWYAMNVKSKKKFNLTDLSTNGFEAYKKTIENLEKLRKSQPQQPSPSSNQPQQTPSEPTTTTNPSKESEASPKKPESEQEKQEKEAEDWYSTLTLA
jgi:hypothetical protein